MNLALGGKQMKVEVRESGIHGKGVFAREPIARCEVILAIDDSRSVGEEHPVQKDLGENPDHCDYLPDGTTVLMQEPERYINHSCDPNVFVYSVGECRFLLAMRELAADEELVYDYSVNAVDGDVWGCSCGASNCRGRHKCDFFALPTQRQLEYLPYLDPWFASVHRSKILDLLKRNAEQNEKSSEIQPSDRAGIL